MAANIKTPVKNLYIGSCWATQMGGVPGALSAAYRCAPRNKVNAGRAPGTARGGGRIF
jgi:phytoene dehydrogenase-like protein